MVDDRELRARELLQVFGGISNSGRRRNDLKWTSASFVVKQTISNGNQPTNQKRKVAPEYPLQRRSSSHLHCLVVVQCDYPGSLLRILNSRLPRAISVVSWIPITHRNVPRTSVMARSRVSKRRSNC